MKPKGNVQYATSKECKTVIKREGSVKKSKNLLGESDSMDGIESDLTAFFSATRLEVDMGCFDMETEEEDDMGSGTGCCT